MLTFGCMIVVVGIDTGDLFVGIECYKRGYEYLAPLFLGLHLLADGVVSSSRNCFKNARVGSRS